MSNLKSSSPLPSIDNCFYPVVVIGSGPTGLVLSNLLGSFGVKCLLLEKNASTVGEPRAVSIDDESLRAVQSIGKGALHNVIKNVLLGYGSHYISPHGNTFASVVPLIHEYGFTRRNAFRAPYLEKTLKEELKNFPSVEVRFLNKVTEIIDEKENIVDGNKYKIKLLVEDLSQSPSYKYCVFCDFVIGCDGGRSFVRQKINAKMCGSTYSQKWVIIDGVGTKDRFRHTIVYSDPRRPAISLPGPEGTRRYEFLLLEGEAENDVLKDEFINNLISNVNPLDKNLKITRKTIYGFTAQVANKWRKNDVFLAGDAAHLSPPFAGQGMNSGIRDSYNLAWKLAYVQSNKLGVHLLDSYETEREPHATQLIELAQKYGYYHMPTSSIQGFILRNLMRSLKIIPPLRDYILQMRFKPKPKLGKGFYLNSHNLCGRLFIQPKVEESVRERKKLDDVISKGFNVIIIDNQIKWNYSNDMERRLKHVQNNLMTNLPTEFEISKNNAYWVINRDWNFPLHAAVPGAETNQVHEDDYMNGITYIRDYRGEIENYAKVNDLPPCCIILRPDKYILTVIPMYNSEEETVHFNLLKELVLYTWNGNKHLMLNCWNGRSFSSFSSSSINPSFKIISKYFKYTCLLALPLVILYSNSDFTKKFNFKFKFSFSNLSSTMFGKN